MFKWPLPAPASLGGCHPALPPAPPPHPQHLNQHGWRRGGGGSWKAVLRLKAAFNNQQLQLLWTVPQEFHWFQGSFRQVPPNNHQQHQLHQHQQPCQNFPILTIHPAESFNNSARLPDWMRAVSFHLASKFSSNLTLQPVARFGFLRTHG